MSERFIPNPDGIKSDWARPEGILIPDIIYRAIHISGVSEALADGFDPSWDGLVYFCDTPANAANFLALRMPASEIIAIGVLTRDITLDRFDVGRDHVPDFWPGEVFTIEGHVDPEFILDEMYEFSGADDEVDA